MTVISWSLPRPPALSPDIPVAFSFPEEEKGEEVEDREAAALHRDVWDSSCNPWPLPQRQVSHAVI